MKLLFNSLLIFFSVALCAEPQMGDQYRATQQQITNSDSSKIEVVELFWYGCPHCFFLEPQLSDWVKKLAKDVNFIRIPAIARAEWVAGAKAYYAMEALGITEKLHPLFFNEIHRKKTIRPNDDKAIIDWIAKQGGLDHSKVKAVYNSFSVNTKMMQATKVFKDSGATGVPSLIIDGKYLTSVSLAGSNGEALDVADYLIEKSRTERLNK